eukprot:s2710_g2.t1
MECLRFLPRDLHCLGLVGLGAGTSARQLLQLLPERRLVAWETSKAVLMAADFCGGIRFDRLEVSPADYLILPKVAWCTCLIQGTA